MDLRDPIHAQIDAHIATLRILASQPTPAMALWEEMQRILGESATHLELHILPKIEQKTPYLDLRTGQQGNHLAKVAEFVGATTEPTAAVDDLGIAIEPAAFLNNGREAKR